jgi:hypothetical protein
MMAHYETQRDYDADQNSLDYWKRRAASAESQLVAALKKIELLKRKERK